MLVQYWLLFFDENYFSFVRNVMGFVRNGLRMISKRFRFAFITFSHTIKSIKKYTVSTNT